jgi:hypothetical protein
MRLSHLYSEPEKRLHDGNTLDVLKRRTSTGEEGDCSEVMGRTRLRRRIYGL